MTDKQTSLIRQFVTRTTVGPISSGHVLCLEYAVTGNEKHYIGGLLHESQRE